MPRISVVLPCYRTAQYLPELYQRLVAALESCSEGFEIIFVDDGSPDDCWPQIERLAESDERVKGIHLSRNFGQHPAICAGFDAATGDVVVLMDADLQDRPEDIPLLLKSLQGGVEIVYSVKEANHETGLTRLTSHIYHRVFSNLTNTNVPTNIGTMRLFSRRFLAAMREYPERNIVLGPLMFHMGYQHEIVELPRDKRQGSQSSYSFRKRLALAVNSLLSYTDLPHRFLVWFGAIVFGLSVVYSVILVVSRVFAWQDAPSGLTLLALLISLSLGATMVGLGIIGMYVFRVYQEVLRRPRYLVARRLNLSSEKML